MRQPTNPFHRCVLKAAQRAVLGCLCLLTAPGALTEDWSFSGSVRLRGEGLENSFYVKGDNDYEQLASRVLLSARWQRERWGAELELEDARVFGVDDDAPLGTDQVNTLEPLQAYLTWIAAGPAAVQAKLGRFTKDLGSRRLVARNGFRNTINGFEGLDLQWQDASGRRWQAFAVSPVARQPDQRELLRNNRPRLDRSSPGQRLLALHMEQALPQQFGALALYVIALSERDREPVPTRNRRLRTAGLRWHSAFLPGQFDTDVEIVLQRGQSRSSDRNDDELSLGHRAAFVHTELGRSFNTPWQARLELFYDYASGDRAPDDAQTQRFDTLYGARRWELGPTGIYGAIARTNLSSPGVRASLQPTSTWRAETVWRDLRLASPSDGFAASGLRDSSGASGSRVGTQWEATLSYDAIPGRLRAELGYVHLRHGEFLRATLAERSQSFTRYAYLQTVFSF